jgi:hypothetical protein
LIRCRIGLPPFVERMVGRAAGAEPGKGGDMAAYLIAFNNEWVPELTDEDQRRASRDVTALRHEMKAAGVLIFLGGLDVEGPVFSVDPTGGSPELTEGHYVESEQHLGGFTVVNVPDEEQARVWAAKIAVACGWPQEVRQFGDSTRASS